MKTKKKQMQDSFSFQPFKDLKRIMENRKAQGGAVPSSPPSSVRERKEEEMSDDELFLKAMQEVREIEEFRKIPLPERKSPPLRRRTSSDLEALRALDEIARGRRPVHLPDTQEYVEWVNPDYHGEIARKLHCGLFSVQDCLDLHGLILDEAEAEVEKFLRGSLARRLRCIKVIHGRGLRSPHGPVLKEALIRWLSGHYRRHIIAFVTARQCDGGLGALYVLLQ
ncbi:MAG: Smr/MutS family protein [Alphaproteobacteria bacterium]|uniref:Smr/MutS family protein n=1 Tax=Candidatus Nitrobium versatile TaxID=2884831 RepID=A0A953J9S3_9BACT|nr:Smr/MutS family protein [Candidatus Nitrobium versatile]